MIRLTLLAWLVSGSALALACVGVATVTAGSPVTSLARMALAAAVLAAYTAAVGILVTRRNSRTRRRCLMWGAAVPAAVGLITAAAVTTAAGIGPGLLSALPWLGGALLVAALGPRLPELRLPAWARRTNQTNSLRASGIARR